MSELHKVKVCLTEKQFRKLKNGHNVQLSHRQLVGQNHHLMLHHETAKKIHHAIRQKKGVRITLTPSEFEASGEGLKEFWQGLKNGVRFVKDKIIDSPLYQESIRPLAKKGVKFLTGLAKAVATPVIGEDLANLAEKGINYVGDKTGAYGLKKPRVELSSSFRPLLSHLHPAINPGAQLKPVGQQETKSAEHKVVRRKVMRKGGSFRIA